MHSISAYKLTGMMNNILTINQLNKQHIAIVPFSLNTTLKLNMLNSES